MIPRRKTILYFYPMWHKVSFTLIAQQHVRQLKKYFNVVEIDELAYRKRDLFGKYIIVLHPYFFMASRDPKWTLHIVEQGRTLIGFDVADTDMLGQKAVHLANIATSIIVPSHFSKEVFEKSGVKIPIFVVPHGLESIYYEEKIVPKSNIVLKLREYKKKHNYIYILYILIHSGFRKGAPWVYKVVKEITKMYPNVKLVIKFGALAGHDFELLSKLTNLYFSSYLSNEDMVALYDTCDIYLLFSIGGGFEHCGLQALARNEVVLASNKGSWTEYLPDFCLIPHGNKVKVFTDTDPINSIHCGYGYPVDIDKAIEKLKDVIENLDDYKARVKEYWNKVKHRFCWDFIGEMLRNIFEKFT